MNLSSRVFTDQMCLSFLSSCQFLAHGQVFDVYILRQNLSF